MNVILFSIFVTFSLAHPFHSRFESCIADKQRLCPEETTQESIGQCMQRNYAQISEDCKQAIYIFNQRHAVFLACDEDRTKFCSSAPSRAEIIECMRINWASLSQKCQNAIHDAQYHTQQAGQDSAHPLEEAQHEVNPVEKPHHANPEHPTDCPMKMCSRELQLFCPTANNRESIRDCLKTHWIALTVECQTSIIAVIRAHNEQGQHHQDSQETVQNTESAHHSQEGSVPLIGRNDGHYNHTHIQSTHNWSFWLVRFWWTYPVGIVLLIELMACYRVRLLKRAEKEAATAKELQ